MYSVDYEGLLKIYQGTWYKGPS